MYWLSFRLRIPQKNGKSNQGGKKKERKSHVRRELGHERNIVLRPRRKVPLAGNVEEGARRIAKGIQDDERFPVVCGTGTDDMPSVGGPGRIFVVATVIWRNEGWNGQTGIGFGIDGIDAVASGGSAAKGDFAVVAPFGRHVFAD